MLPFPAHRDKWKGEIDGARMKVSCEPLLRATEGGCSSREGELRDTGDGQTSRTLPVLMGPCHPVPNEKRSPAKVPVVIMQVQGGAENGPAGVRAVPVQAQAGPQHSSGEHQGPGPGFKCI